MERARSGRCGTVRPVIGYIEGTAVSERVVKADGTGVGYVVARPQPFAGGERVALWVTTVVREDSINLYGFSTCQEQACFVALCKVSGVGANTALAVLRDAGVSGVVSKDPKQLARTQGVGPKLAARIADQIEIPESLTAAAAGGQDKPAVAELADTLCALGFPESTAMQTARKVIDDNPDGSDETWIAGALAILRGAQ